MDKKIVVDIDVVLAKLRALKCGNKYAVENRIWKGDIWDRAISECLKEIEKLKHG